MSSSAARNRRFLRNPTPTCAVLAILAAISTNVAAQSPSSAGQKAPQSASSGITSSLYLRVRPEWWGWFGESDGARYAFVGVQARAALLQQRARWSWRLELAAPSLLWLPNNAILPPPQGQLGFGGTYFAANDSIENAAHIFLRQGFVRIGRPPAAGGAALRLGRFEFNDGLETIPTNATLAWLTRERIAQRLIGTFGFSHVGRTFDGLHGTYDWGGRNATAVVFRPTEGVFDVDGWPDLDVGVAYASFTFPHSTKRVAADGRVFFAGYRDARDAVSVVKTDNRAAVVRAADRDPVTIATAGAHWIEAVTTGIGVVDVLVWGAAQFGDWGTQSHHGWAGAVEVGWQPDSMPKLNPWLRAGWYRASGDGNPTDDTHSTYFSMLPTPRPYARYPFYTLMNLEDVYASLILRPSARVTTRFDARHLRLANGRDLWYVGGGAFERSTFGYVGRPADGGRQLASLFDLSVEWRVTSRWTVTAYAAAADGGIVPRHIYPTGANARYAYIETQFVR